MALVALEALDVDIFIRRKSKWYYCAVQNVAYGCILRLGVYIYFVSAINWFT